MQKYLTALFLIIILSACNNNLSRLSKLNPSLGLSHAQNTEGNYNIDLSRDAKFTSKSFKFTDKSGEEKIINEAVKDEVTGEMVSMVYLNEIVVSAKSQNIPERNGVIRLDFIVKIPSILQDSRWQIDMLPVLSRGKDTMHFNRILISGEEFKRAQEKGYRRYEKYLRSIIPDDVDFLEVYTDLPNLILFLERNLPESRVMAGERDDDLITAFGVTEKSAVDHYVKQWLIDRNDKRKAEKEKYFYKYVKNPYLRDIKLDSVIQMGNGDFAYHYSQEILTNDKSSKLFLNLYGQVRDINGMCFELKPCDTIVYNVSSMVGFIDTTTRYKKKIIERKATATMAAFIDFKVGKADIIDTLSNNAIELEKIRKALKDVLSNEVFVLDSLILTASSSPEGAFALNKSLSSRRASSIQKYCEAYIKGLDEEIASYELGTNNKIQNPSPLSEVNSLIIQKTIPEDWDRLRILILNDTTLTNKEKLIECFRIQDLDKREGALSSYKREYKYLREKIYPQLRRVNFIFNLHRKGMVKDTIHTTEIDSLYMNGLVLLKDRKYEDALAILRDYKDFNTAIAHISLGHDRSAEEILLSCPDTAYKIYLMAVLSARKGDEEQAVKFFLRSKELNFSMAYRGGLDPEISSLIRKYNLNKDLFE